MLHTARGFRGAVTSPHHLASQAGLDILRAGGNAVEAAVATAAALSAVYPHMTGMGGDGFWLISWPDGRVEAIDACGRSSLTADPARYAGMTAVPWRGALAANTVAGAVSGWALALERAGEQLGRPLPLARILADAVHYAEVGVPVSTLWAYLAREKREGLVEAPGYAALFEPDGVPLRETERFCNPALAETLRVLGRDGLDTFYRGVVGALLAEDLAAAGAPVTREDLAAHRSAWVEPLRADLSCGRVYNMTPPTQGAASLLILALLDRYGARDVDTPEGLHAVIEATKLAFRYRDAEIGDPAFVACDPQGLLDDDAALRRMVAEIDPGRAAPWPHPSGGGDTTWFGVVDSNGCAVSVIQSIYFEFGSGVVLPRTGIVWQNRGASFSLGDAGPNRFAAGRKPFHTLNPALARLHDGRVLAYGTMGGEGQPQTQAAVFSRYVWGGQALQPAVTAPRWLLGRTWGETVTGLKIEGRMDEALKKGLRERGHAPVEVAAFDSMMGHAGALVRHADGLIEGASDPRSDGVVAAW